MPTTRVQRNDTSEAAIFARVWESSDGAFSPELARHVLRLGFSEKDKERMHELAAKNQEASLSADELEELDNYVTVGNLLAILQSKARKLLRRKTAAARRHG